MGWYTNPNYNEKSKITELPIGTTGDIKLYAKLIPYTATVKFDANAPEGKKVKGSMNPTTIAYDGSIYYDAPANKFSVDGYVFAGWTIGNYVDSFDERGIHGKYLFGEGDNFKDNNVVTLKAKWSKDITVTYVTYEGKLSGEGIESVNYGVFKSTYNYAQATKLPIPTKEGYRFDNWYTSSDFNAKSKVTAINKLSDANTTLYAKWIANTAKVIYDANGGKGSMPVQIVRSGELAKPKDCNFTRKGYKFIGWYGTKEKPSNSNDLINPEDPQYSSKLGTVRDNDNNTTIRLYAQWEAIPYSISYDTAGGIFKTAPTDAEKNYTIGAKFDLPTDLTREGYTFAGWYTDKNYKSKIKSVTPAMAENLELYAKWSANYTIKFHENSANTDKGISGTMTDQKGKFETSLNIKNCSYKVAKGYGFAGWALEDGSTVVTYANKEKLIRPEKLTLKDGKFELNLYAVYDNNFTIKYNPEGGSTPIGARDTYSYGSVYEKNAKGRDIAGYTLPRDITRTGYKFIDWYTNPELTGAPIKKITNTTAGNLELYAKWQPEKYTIVFHMNDGTKKTKTQSLSYEVATKLTKNNFKSKGYTFRGWVTNHNDWSSVDYEDQAEITNQFGYPGKNKINLYAQWYKEVYKITYVCSNNSRSYRNYDVNTTEDLLAWKPTALGSTFVGWYADPEFRRKVTSIKKGSTGDITLYAKFVVNKK